MTNPWKPCLYSGNALDNQWMNTIFNSHDLYCGCLDPVNHFNSIIKKQQCRRFKDTGTETEDITTTKEEDIPDVGDLEKLFEDTGENDQG